MDLRQVGRMYEKKYYTSAVSISLLPLKLSSSTKIKKSEGAKYSE